MISKTRFVFDDKTETNWVNTNLINKWAKQNNYKTIKISKIKTIIYDDKELLLYEVV